MPSIEKGYNVEAKTIHAVEDFDPNKPDYPIPILRRMAGFLKKEELKVSTIPTNIGDENIVRQKFKDQTADMDSELLDEIYRIAKERYIKHTQLVQNVEQSRAPVPEMPKKINKKTNRLRICKNAGSDQKSVQKKEWRNIKR